MHTLSGIESNTPTFLSLLLFVCKFLENRGQTYKALHRTLLAFDTKCYTLDNLIGNLQRLLHRDFVIVPLSMHFSFAKHTKIHFGRIAAVQLNFFFTIIQQQQHARLTPRRNVN